MKYEREEYELEVSCPSEVSVLITADYREVRKFFSRFQPIFEIIINCAVLKILYCTCIELERQKNRDVLGEFPRPVRQ